MDIPSKPGTYWFKTKDGNWKTAIIGRFAVHMSYASWTNDHFAETFNGGTFGPMVPTPDELTAMEEVIDAAKRCRGQRLSEITSRALVEIDDTLDALDAIRKGAK